MAQHDYVLENAGGAAFRADLNNVLSAIVSLNAGGTEPSPMFPHMFWLDTSAAILKKRNAANTAWIPAITFDETGNVASFPGSLDLSTITVATAPAAADRVPFYDVSILATRAITLANLFKVIGDLTTLTTPAPTDLLPLYDASGLASFGMTLADMLKVINGLTEQTTPVPATDFLLMYDVAASAVRKVKPASLIAAAGLTTIASGSLTGASVSITDIAANFSQLILKIVDAESASDSRLTVRLSTNNGSSYDSTAGNYLRNSFGEFGGGPALVGGASASLIENGSSLSGASLDEFSALINILGYQGGPWPRWQGTIWTDTGAIFESSGAYKGSTSAINAIRIQPGSGTFSGGTYALYGVG